MTAMVCSGHGFCASMCHCDMLEKVATDRWRSAPASEGHDQTGAMLPALLRRVTVSGDTIRIELSNRALLDGTTGCRPPGSPQPDPA